MRTTTRSLSMPVPVVCAAAAAAVMACAVGGCNDATVKLYHGPWRSRQQVVRVYNTDRAILLRVDDKKVGTDARWSAPPEHVYEMPPGRHALTVARLERMRNWSDDPQGTALFEHDLVPGREYSFVVEESRSTGRTPISWSVTMVEFPGGVFVANPVVPPRDRDTGGRE